MTDKRGDCGIWADKGELSDHNPRYLHARFLSGCGYTPESVSPPDGWFESHGTNVYPIEMIVGDDWKFLEDNEDLSPASRIKIAIEIMKGFQHIRDCKRAIIWDTKPEHMLIQGFCSPDDMSHISIKFIDLETIFLLDRNVFSTMGDPTPFTLNSIARQQSILVQGGIFDPESEVIESMIDYIRGFCDPTDCRSLALEQELDDYWTKTIHCNFDNFLDCLYRIRDHIVGQSQQVA